MGLSGALPDWRDLQQQVRRQTACRAAGPYVESQRCSPTDCAWRGRACAAYCRGGTRRHRSGTDVTSGSLDDLKAGAYEPFSQRARARATRAWAIRCADRAAARQRPPGSCRACARFRVVGLFQSACTSSTGDIALVHNGGRRAPVQLGEAVTGLRLAFI